MAGLAATIVMGLLVLAAHGLALLASSLPLSQIPVARLERPNPVGPAVSTDEVWILRAPGAEALETWLYSLTHNQLTDPTNVQAYIAAGAFLLSGLGWAFVYALLIEPRMSGADWLRGVKFSLVPVAVSLLVLLPVVGAGPFGADLGAGPLPLIWNVLGYLIYGAVLGVTYGASTDAVFGPATAADVLVLRRSTRRSALGFVGGGAGGLLGAAVGTTLAPSAALSDSTWPFGMPPVAVLLAATLIGAVMGGLFGSLAGLPMATETDVRADVWEPPVASESPATPVTEPDSEHPAVGGERLVAPAGPRLRVVSINGVCPNGYKLGDSFTCSATGQLSPALCPAASRVVEPVVAEMLQGGRNASAWVACPIEDHMLVLQIEREAAAQVL